MLEIKNIHKQYKTGSFIQTALNDVSLNLRDNEFVSILGPSGSGKTTLLNIIGGLDQYDSGDVVINHVSTKNYKDKDWDSYRSHSVGFIFQSYNLIPHQTLLQNVELALTISNVPSSKRKKLAKDALAKVGLQDHINKKPNQLSGGQMQRVAIARALVNNPDIILADEPTGALDSKTSVQVMELLKEVAKDRLVVMVTHNPELAKQYSSRIVELKDGVLLSDSNPYEITEQEQQPAVHKTFGRVGMSLFTSMRLSFKNLLSKGKRTLLVSVAGSIGIIGISMIMAVSNGANDYIQTMEEQTLSEYPLSIKKSALDMSSMLTVRDSMIAEREDDKIHEQQVISGMFGTIQENDLKSFKEYLESGKTQINDYVNAIEYNYSLTPYIYKVNSKGQVRQVSPDNVIESTGLSTFASLFAGQTTTFTPLPVDKSLYESQYEVLRGHWPNNTHEIVVVLNSMNDISDLAIYNLELKDPAELDAMIESYQYGTNENKLDVGNPGSWEYDEVMGREFKLVNIADMYTYDENLTCWVPVTEQDEINQIVKNGMTLRVVGVVRPTKEAATPILSPGLCYSSDLVYDIINSAKESEIVKEQLANPEINVFTGKSFDDTTSDFDMSTMFNFDEGAFDEIFAFDSDSIDFDTSAFDNINIGSFNLGNYINSSSLSAMMGDLTEAAIEELFRGVTIDITQEKLMALFQNLYNDFIDSTNGDPSMNINNLSSSIKTFLQTDEAKTIVKNTLEDQLSGSSSAIMNSYEFTSKASELLRAYISYVIDNEMDPTDSMSIQFFLQTIEAQNIIDDMSRAAANAIEDMINVSELSTKLINNLSAGYIDYAEFNNLPIVDKIIAAFLSYLKTERAMNIIMAHAETMIDMQTLKNNLDSIATDVGNQIATAIGTQLGSAMSSLGTQLGIQIENAITTAMTDYMENLASSFDFSTDSLMQVIDANMSAEKMKEVLANMLSPKATTMKSNLQKLGYADVNDPESITFYPIDFEKKANVVNIINEYNEAMNTLGETDKIINFTDMVGSLMSSVTSIIDIIGYVLIAFVSISLVVSSIMIGVITYISVLERKKEIGILRAMGASKRNVTQVFNCETIITGFLAGIIGVGLTWLILIPTNLILQKVTGQPNLNGFLPVDSATFLVILSMTLTTIGGLMPSKSAAKQDPVIALRAE